MKRLILLIVVVMLAYWVLARAAVGADAAGLSRAPERSALCPGP